jgi:hypothetical protein
MIEMTIFCEKGDAWEPWFPAYFLWIYYTPIKMAIAGLRNLCTPAYVYLVISLIAMVIMLFQNLGGSSVYCLGTYECDVTSVTLVFIVKLIYVLFWTWVLNLICRAGATPLSWFLVLFPFLLMFVLLGLMMIA